jgi:hypothetical protein
MESSLQIAIGEEVKDGENKKNTMASTLIETNKAVLEEVKAKVASEGEVIEGKRRPTTSIEEQALQEPPLTPKTISDKEKAKVAIEEAEFREKKRPTLASTSIEEQALSDSPLMPKTILDKENTKVVIKEAEIGEKKRPTSFRTSTYTEDQFG